MADPSHDPSFTTTFRLPFSLQAQLDAIRLERAIRTGHRPKMRDLVIEALTDFVGAHANAPRPAHRPTRGGAR